MNYRLNERSLNNIKDNAIENVLKNRGIEDVETYLNLTEDVVNDFRNLNNIEKAVEVFKFHYDAKNMIGILVDEDPDGYTSAAMFYNYVKEMDKEYPLKYILHKRAKAHGLSDDVEIPDDIKLLVIPDAGTNDAKQCKDLNRNGIEIIILDHHEAEKNNLKAISNNYKKTTIVNNQMSEKYTNKSLCGAGVVYRFLQALDEAFWQDSADNYLDLCALGNISDVMDMRSPETKYLVELGLSNINSKMFEALINAQSYSMQDVVNIHNVQWYITPILNGMIRIGRSDEKELLFRAFIETDETFPYKKRGSDKEIQERIYDRAARLCKNAKSRQDKMRDKAFKEIVDNTFISEDDKVVMADVTDILDPGLTGVVAIKVAEYFNRPCILLKKYLDKKKNNILYGGSARNINHSPIVDFKQVVNSANVFNYGQGHANAFGISLDLEKLSEANSMLNDILCDVDYDSTFIVDYVIDALDIDALDVYQFESFSDLLGQGIDEPTIAIENVELSKDDIQIFGKSEDTISFMVGDIKYIQFRCKPDNPIVAWLEDWDNDDQGKRIVLSIVGKPSINEYNGVKTPQIVIEDTEVIKVVEPCSDEDEWDEDW